MTKQEFGSPAEQQCNMAGATPDNRSRNVSSVIVLKVRGYAPNRAKSSRCRPVLRNESLVESRWLARFGEKIVACARSSA